MTVYIIAKLQTHKDDNVNMFVTVVMVSELLDGKGKWKIENGFDTLAECRQSKSMLLNLRPHNYLSFQ